MAIRRLRHVQQSNRSTGCGPACLAILSGESEGRAIEAVFGEPRTRELRTRWPDLRKGLEALRVEFERPARRVTQWSKIPETAIVGCGKSKNDKGQDVWHWVVYQPDGKGSGLVYDPAKEHPYVPTARNRKPFSFLPVTPRS